jgi:hypothetical protein
MARALPDVNELASSIRLLEYRRAPDSADRPGGTTSGSSPLSWPVQPASLVSWSSPFVRRC